MNPLTLVKRIQNINSREAALGISEDASWHAKYKDSAYVFVGGIPFDLTEGDLLAIFAQYGEIVDVNLVRDQGTGKSKGFAFIAYEDQRSTNLAVDNLNGAQVLGRVIRVDHVSKYKKKEEEDEEERQKKREERGVCRAFQRGNCTRGDGCKFSHDEQRAANTGWGAEDKDVRWGHDKYDDPKTRGEKNSGHPPREPYNESKSRDGHRSYNVDSRTNAKEREIRNDAKGHKSSRRYHDDFEPKLRDLHDDRGDINVRRYGSKNDYERSSKDYNRSGESTHEESRTNRNDDNSREPKARDDRDRREQKRSRRHDDDDDDIKPRSRDGHDRRGKNKSRRA